MSKATILLLEDNLSLLKSNAGILTMSGYRVVACADVKQAREAIQKEAPDLLVLDVMLPDGSGTDFCREYRALHGKGKPVLFLSVMKKKPDLLAGYDAGGTDYLTKPFDMDVFLLKVEALLEQFDAAGTAPAKTLSIGRITLDLIALRAFVNGADLNLRTREFTLLRLFMENENRLLSMEYIYEKVWGQPMGEDKNALQAAISRLRKKIEHTEYEITATRDKGYILEKK